MRAQQVPSLPEGMKLRAETRHLTELLITQLPQPFMVLYPPGRVRHSSRYHPRVLLTRSGLGV